MKILKQSNGDIPLCIPKLVRVVRISLFLLFIVMTQLHAENLYSQNTVINLKLENATVEQVLDKIEKETLWLGGTVRKILNDERYTGKMVSAFLKALARI